MKSYTVGFIFNESLTEVLLIHKNRPDWQNGKINGLGGRIEDGEASIDCIAREIQEECGLITSKETWVLLGNMYKDGFSLDVYAYVYNGDIHDAETLTDEIVQVYKTSSLPENVIPNLHWIIPLAIDRLAHNMIGGFSMELK